MITNKRIIYEIYIGVSNLNVRVSTGCANKNFPSDAGGGRRAPAPHLAV